MEQTIESLIRRFGLIAVFVGGATEGDGTLIVTGALAHLGYFNFVVATFLGCLGAFCIDVMWYTLGRTRADSIRNSRLYSQAGASVERLAARIGAWQVVIARFIFGARIPSMIFWGMHGTPIIRFVVLDFIGCALWAGFLSGLGYAFSTSLASLMDEVKRAERRVVVLLIVIGAVVIGHTVLRRLMKSRQARSSTSS